MWRRFLTRLLIATALVACNWGAMTFAQAPNEVILYSAGDFQGPSESFTLEPWLYQRIVDLTDRPTWQFLSMKVGADVVVTVLVSLGPGGTAGGGSVGGIQIFDTVGPGPFSFPYVKSQPSAIVINRTADIDPELGRRSVPFRASLADRWESVLFQEGFTRWDHVLLSETAQGRRCTNLVNLGQDAGEEEGADQLWIHAGRFRPALMEVTLFSEYDCKGRSRSFSGKSTQTHIALQRLNFVAGFTLDPRFESTWRDRPRSVALEWLGPKRPDAPADVAVPGSRQAPVAPGDRRAPEAPGDRRAPEAPDDPLGSPAQAEDEITRRRLVQQTGDMLRFEVDYRVSPAHGAIVYAGGWLYAGGEAFGGYLPVELPSIGEGMVTIEIALGGETKPADEVEFFFFEGGQSPFISRRFPFSSGPTGQILAPKELTVHDYRGCFKDAEQRDLQGFHLENAGMTIDMCLSICKERGFPVAAVQFSSHCFCGESFGRYGPATNCNMQCGGDPSETCGGSWANSVFRVP